MRSVVALLYALWLVCSAAHPAHAAATDERFASDAQAAALFSRLPEYETALLSPDGRWLAVAMSREGFRAVAIVDAQHFEPSHIVRFDPPNEADRFYWATDNRLLISVVTRVGRLEVPVATGELYAVDADGGNGRIVFDGVVESAPIVHAAGNPERGELPVIAPGPRRRQRLLSLLPDAPNDVLIATQIPGPDGARATEAFRLDIKTGGLRRDVRAPTADAALLADADGNVRFAATRDRALALHVYSRTPQTEWRERMQRAWGDGDWLPVAFDGPERVLVLENLHSDLLGASVLHLRSETLAPLFRDHRVDVDAVLSTAPGERPYALRYRPDHSRYVQFAEPTPARHLFAQGLAAFPQHDIELTSITRSGDRGILRVRDDRDPGSLYLIERGATPTLLLRSRAWLPADALAPTQIIDTKAADGTPLQLFVTRPQTSSAALPPIVVHPHGGPNGARDDWLFHELAQLLAARGYLVLRVNYRGSAGYGRRFGELGDGEWSGAMLDDVMVGLEHVVAAGLGDGARVAMVGESYGAYAALMSAVRWPARFRCVVGSAGVYDLGLLQERGDLQRSSRGRALLQQMLGKDMNALRLRSPIAHAAELRVPVLLVHGERDSRVPIEHAKRMRDALAEAGHPAEYLELPGEGHGYFGAANRERYFTQLLAFLARHLFARIEPITVQQSATSQVGR